MIDTSILKQLEAQSKANIAQAEALLGQVESPALKAVLSDALARAKDGNAPNMEQFMQALVNAQKNG